MKYFCTLFDHNYLFKGLALQESLIKNCPDVKLFILTMSAESHKILSDLKLEKTELIQLGEFEDEELLKIKESRTPAEYCWTITPSLPLYVLKKKPSIDMISYIDADCFYFSSPEPLFTELGNDSTLIIEHRYSNDRLRFLPTSGRFNVGMLTFKNDSRGREVLNWWREKCIEWCFYRVEPGRMGDQFYLNYWPEKFAGVHILRHKGGCLAPWNIWRFRTNERSGQVFVDNDPLVFYHFHAFKIFENGQMMPSHGYDFSANQLKLIYEPYQRSISRQIEKVRVRFPDFAFGYSPEATISPPVSELSFRMKIKLKYLRWLIFATTNGLRTLTGLKPLAVP
jgi:hypothetical protein